MGVDLTEYSAIVIEHALDQAARHQSPELHFLNVEESGKRAAEEIQQRLAAIVYPSLQVFNEFSTDWRARLHIKRGRPDQQIPMLAQDIRADLIVIGQFGLHQPRQTRKGVPSRVLVAAPCATLVVGMPHSLDTGPQCGACAAVREDTEGECWFCAEHRSARRTDHVVTPMTIWSGGSLMW